MSIQNLYDKILRFSKNNYIAEGVSNFLNYYGWINDVNNNFILNNSNINNSDISLMYYDRANNIKIKTYGFDQAADGQHFVSVNSSNKNILGSEFSDSRSDIYMGLEPTSKEYARLKKYVQQELFPGMDNETANRFISIINENGACSYAATLAELFLQFKNREQEFKSIFGVDLYKKNRFGGQIFRESEYDSKTGKYVMNKYVYLNTDYILANLFARSNYFEGDSLIRKDENGKWMIADKIEVDGKLVNPQFYFSGLSIDGYGYLSANNSDTNIEYIKSMEQQSYIVKRAQISDNIIYKDGVTKGRKNKPSQIKKVVIDALNSGKTVRLGTYFSKETSNEPLKLYIENSDNSIYINSLGGNHAMIITGVTNDGKLIISTWGKRAYINIDELAKRSYTITEVSIENVEQNVNYMQNKIKNNGFTHNQSASNTYEQAFAYDGALINDSMTDINNTTSDIANKEQRLNQLTNIKNSDSYKYNMDLEKEYHKLKLEIEAKKISAESLLLKEEEMLSELKRIKQDKGYVYNDEIENNIKKLQTNIDIRKEAEDLSKELEQIASDNGMSLKEYGKQTGSSDIDPPEIQEKATSLAIEIRKRAERIEPQITSDVKDLESVCASLIGEEHKLKSVASLSRKIKFIFRKRKR